MVPSGILPNGSSFDDGASRRSARWTSSRWTTRSSTSETSTLQGGATLRDAKLAYKTFGELNGDKSNAIVYPTWYSGRHWDNEWLIGDGMALDPAKYFIIVPNMLGNGLSTSPSNTPPPYDKARFPNVTFYDQVEQQHKLVTEKFGIETLPLVTGWSMGAGQTYQWAVSYPDMVQRAVPVLRLLEDQRAQHRLPGGREGGADRPTTRSRAAGTRRSRQGPAGRGARVRRLGLLAGLLLGPASTRTWATRTARHGSGFPTLEDFLVEFWEGFFLDRRDPNNLLTMLWTWQNGDIGATPGFDGDHVKALQSIKAKLDRAARPEGPVLPAGGRGVRVAAHPERRVRVIPGVWGHFAGGGANPVDTQVHRRRPQRTARELRRGSPWPPLLRPSPPPAPRSLQVASGVPLARVRVRVLGPHAVARQRRALQHQREPVRARRVRHRRARDARRRG